MLLKEWLQKAELFGALGDAQLEALLSQPEVESFPEGKMIFSQGEEANRLYVLIQGSVELTIKAQEKIDFMSSNIEREGAVFGTASLMEPFRYNVTAVCLKPSRALVLNADHIKRAMEDDPKMGMEMMKKLASIYFKRLNDLRAGVSDLLNTLKMKMP
ncbi:MAG: cyclic nucleotide-binding domain-containing protein [Thermodesulfobacteriota bacterium]